MMRSPSTISSTLKSPIDSDAEACCGVKAKIYLVGGAVRDQLMGLPSSGDRDWVVVGSSVEAMVHAGFKPVGADFPVFLHPQTHEQYALARTERKTARGYHGFTWHADPAVSLEADLGRRDLTINAMAMHVRGDPCDSPCSAELIDPFGGARDIEAKVLRHVSPAFAEDPVRILRVARFAAQLGDFTVAAQTTELMRQMVQDGEANALVAERVWQEISRGLMCPKPSRMFEVLRSCGALAVLCPELDALWGVPQPIEHHPEVDTGVHVMMVIDRAAALQAPLAVRVACLFHDLGKGTTAAAMLPRHVGHEARSLQLLHRVCARWRVPGAISDLSAIVAREHGHIHRSAALGAKATLHLLERCDAIRRPQRFDDILCACECDATGRLGHTHSPYPVRTRLLAALRAVSEVNSAAIARAVVQRGLAAQHIGAHIHAARLQALQLLDTPPTEA